MFRSDAALLADEMGLGKTVQAAIAIKLALRSPDVNRVLIVAPSALTLNWQRELARWAPELSVRRLTGSDDDRVAAYLLPIPVVVASYDQVRIDALDRIPDDTFDLVVLDEAQRIKNRDSRTAFACRLLPRKRAWALTATPLENSRRDLESVFAFLKPGLVSKNTDKEELFVLIEPHLLRRRKAEVMGELPPVIAQDVMLELSPRQREAYDDVWTGRRSSMANDPRPISSVTLFAVLTRLKQICNFDRASGDSSKLDALRSLVDSAQPSDKILVFSQFVESIQWISERLDSFPVETYHGGQSLEERDAVISRFETSAGPRLLLISLRAGGVGLNLESATTVVLFDRWWNPAVETQAIFRAHRFSRKTPLYVVRFLVADSVEERIDDILVEKQALFEEYVNGAPSADVSPLSRHELMRVLDLTVTDVGDD